MDPTLTSISNKMRLMVSYGGHIIPRLHTKSLYYAGGDTRIITIPSATSLSISSFISHLAATLHVSAPFIVKYQLPRHDLDSLISLSTDDDLQIMLEEHQRLSSTPAHSRIRLFVFPAKSNLLILPESSPADLEHLQMHRREGNGGGSGPTGFLVSGAESGQSELCGSVLSHPKTESWFVDALRSARIMQKGRNVVVGYGAESGGTGPSEGNGVCGQESIVLETSSSFGSTSSSVSLFNLPPIKGHGEDNSTQLQDNKPKPDSVPSDNGVAMGISCSKTGTCQDLVAPIAEENNNSASPFESDNKIPEHPSTIQMHRPVHVSGIPINPQLDPPQHQLQFVHTGTHYVPQNPPGVLPVTSYYPIYHPMPPPQQQQLHYQSNQPCPVYYIHVAQAQPYNYPVQCSLIHSATAAPGQVQMHPSASIIPPQVVFKEVAAAPPPVPELASQIYTKIPAAAAASPLHVPHVKTEQKTVAPQMHQQPQTFGVASGEKTNFNNELDDDLARVQIYKSQPPPPTLPSQYQTMTKATTVMFSEALAQLQTENV